MGQIELLPAVAAIPHRTNRTQHLDTRLAPWQLLSRTVFQGPGMSNRQVGVTHPLSLSLSCTLIHTHSLSLSLSPTLIHTHSHTYPLSLSLSLFLTLSPSLSLSLSLLLSLSLTHSLSFSLSLTHTLPLSHTHTPSLLHTPTSTLSLPHTHTHPHPHTHSPTHLDKSVSLTLSHPTTQTGKSVCLYPNGGDPMMTEPDLVTIDHYAAVDDASLIAHINTKGNFK